MLRIPWYMCMPACANRLVGAYLIGVLVSDVLAYKSNSAGFKRGKVNSSKTPSYDSGNPAVPS